MSGSIEKTILSNLLHSEQYARKVIPFIKPEYFIDKTQGIVADTLVNFFNQYNHPPSLDILTVELSKRQELKNQQVFSTVEQFINELDFVSNDQEWLVKETEGFCKKRAVTLAILDAYEIVEGNDKTRSEDAIPSLLSEALSVSFDSSIGHDYFADYESRYDFYHKVDEKLPFDLELFNKITNGGLSRKTLNVIMAGPKVGKSMLMCHIAASTLLLGKNVLYITMEMAEERIAERIDANLLDVNLSSIRNLDKEQFSSKINRLINKTKGQLIIKEYPTSGAHAGHFKALLQDLKSKKKFVPDLIIVDYLNICSSSRVKLAAGANSYTYVKSIAEELRGLAVEFNVPILSATQVNRAGVGNTDVDMTNTSESMGLPMTVDIMLAMISTDELEELGQIMVKQIANRYADSSYYKRFVIGVNRAKMKFFDLEESAQKDIIDSGQDKDDDMPAFDKSSFGKRMKTAGTDFKF